MSVQVVLQAVVGKTPDFNHLVPASRDDDRGVRGGREAHARHPISVTIMLLELEITSEMKNL